MTNQIVRIQKRIGDKSRKPVLASPFTQLDLYLNGKTAVVTCASQGL